MAENKLINNIRKNIPDIVAAGLVVAVLGIMLVSVPSPLISLLLVINLAVSLVILLISFYVLEPLEFSTFPSVLLLTTLFRLSLNIASTKLILGPSKTTVFTEKAGVVIRFFGEVVTQNDPIVGLVIFIIIVIIQFVVITKGATRVAEVAARFTLDAMPGKQMAIDADLNSGLIDETQARERREKIASEADFYGAMDGASKFVRGDAIAGIIITIINILGGYLVGYTREGLSLSEVFNTYTILTIGDGLVSQIPSLLIALAAGVIVTRSTSDASLGRNLFAQVRSKPMAMALAGVTLLIMAVVGLMSDARAIFFPLGSIGALVVWSAYVMNEQQQKVVEEGIVEEETARAQEGQEPETMERYLRIDPMEIEIGYGLIPLVDAEQGGDLLDRITSIRRQTALEMGFVVPPIRIRDNMQLSPNVYSVKIAGVSISTSQVYPDRMLAMSPTGADLGQLRGIDTTEPAFGLPAKWIAPEDRDSADNAGFNVIAPSVVVATHLTQVIKQNADLMLTRQAVQALIDTLKEASPVIVEELIPDLLGIGSVQKVLQNLLREGIPIKSLEQIFEALGDHAPETRDTSVLTEYVRMALARTITQHYQSGTDGELNVITMDPQIDRILLEEAKKAGEAADPRLARKVVDALKEAVEKAATQGFEPILLTHPQLRLFLKKMVERFLPSLVILSYNEVIPEVSIKSAAIAQMENENTEVHSE